MPNSLINNNYLPANRRGYTLYLVMLILAVAGILFSITIADIRRVRVTSKKEVQRTQAKLLAQSGMMRTEYFLNGGDGHSPAWETDNYEEKVDTFGVINLKVEKFGLFSRVISTGRRLTTGYTLTGLFGRTVPRELEPSLTLTGHVGGLILHKGSSVEGKIVLHHGYVYARKKGTPLPDYTRRLILRESAPLPFDSLELPRIFESYLSKRKSARSQSSGSAGPILLDGSNDSLLGIKPLIVNGDCRITAPRCNGAEIAVSGTCTIEPAAGVYNSFCTASRVIINGGTTESSFFFSEQTIMVNRGNHNSQFLACDSIVIKNEASTGPMALFAAYREKVQKDSFNLITGGIYSDPDMKLKGVFLSCSEPGIPYSSMSPSIVIGNGCRIDGVVVTDGDCFLQDAAVTGRLWARAIVARDDEGSYTNYLVNSSIRLPVSETPFPLLGELPMKIAIRLSRFPPP